MYNYGGDDMSNIKKIIYNAADKAVSAVAKTVASALPDGYTPYVFHYDSENFHAGHESILTSPAEGAAWRLGYADASLLPDDVTNGNYFLGGYLHYPPNRVTDVLDDQMFRCVCADDGSGRGAAVFGVIDCVGISNTDVRRIRAKAAEAVKKYNIVSFNISAVHTHSEPDTLGIWGDIGKALRSNPLKVVSGEKDFVSGRNEAYMDALIEKCARTVERAFEQMKEGRLFYSVADGSRFVRSKRPPDVCVTDIASLIFRPADGSKPTRAVFMAAHPTQFGAANTTVSGDFPYYICRELDEQGENALFFQGAELAAATVRESNIPYGLELKDQIKAYGEAVATFIRENSGEEREIPPLLNCRHKEIMVPVTNYIMLAVGKLRLIDHRMLRAGDARTDIRFVTEIGICSFGGEFSLTLVPGELSPEIMTGESLDGGSSYTGKDWDYAPLNTAAPGYVTCVGLCNDEIGYIIPDNEYGSIFAPKHYEESISAGGQTASKLMREFAVLSKDFNK